MGVSRPAGQPGLQAEPAIEVPHCYTMVQGSSLTAKHRDLMTDTVRTNATYCCVKRYARDLNLVQPPLLVSLSGSQCKVSTAWPTVVHSFRPLSGKKIQTYSKLADLCEHKYGLPRTLSLLWPQTCRPFRPPPCTSSFRQTKLSLGLVGWESLRGTPRLLRWKNELESSGMVCLTKAQGIFSAESMYSDERDLGFEAWLGHFTHCALLLLNRLSSVADQAPKICLAPLSW